MYLNNTRRKALVWRWSIISAGLIGIFWTIWHLSIGSVPVIKIFKMTPDCSLILSFGISRWWDILLGPIFAILLFIFSLKNKQQEIFEPIGLFFYSTFMGFLFGLSIYIAMIASIPIFSGLLYILAGMIIFGIFYGFLSDNPFLHFMYFNLSFGLGFALIFGFAFGLAFAIALLVIIWLAEVSGIKYSRIASTDLLAKKIANFILAKDK